MTDLQAAERADFSVFELQQRESAVDLAMARMGHLL